MPEAIHWNGSVEHTAGPNGRIGAGPATTEGGGEETNLLQQIVATSLGPLSRLSETVDLTLREVSDWIARPENRRDIFNLIGLLNAQTELLMAQHRVSAAARLVGLMHEEDAGPETIRRACKDLLKLRMVERTRAPGQGLRGGDDLEPLPLPAPPAAPSRRKNLRELERELAAWVAEPKGVERG